MQQSAIILYDEIMDMLHQGADSREVDDFIQKQQLEKDQLKMVLKHIDPKILAFERYRAEQDKAMQFRIFGWFVLFLFLAVNAISLVLSGSIFLWFLLLLPVSYKCITRAKSIQASADRLLVDKKVFDR